MQVVETTSRTGMEEVVTMDAASTMGSAIIKAMSDEFSIKILESVVSEGKSVVEIRSETGVPLSTAYRLVHGMTEAGLMVLERVVVTGTGRKYTIYRATFSRISVDFDDSDCKVQGTPNWSVPDIMYRLSRFAKTHSEFPTCSLTWVHAL